MFFTLSSEVDYLFCIYENVYIFDFVTFRLVVHGSQA